MNSKTKIGSMFLLAAVLVAGTVAMTIPKSLAEPEYYGYEDKYAKDPRGFGHDISNKDHKSGSVQSALLT